MSDHGELYVNGKKVEGLTVTGCTFIPATSGTMSGLVKLKETLSPFGINVPDQAEPRAERLDRLLPMPPEIE